MSGYALLSSARDDLDQIWEYIARDSPRAADSVLDDLYSAFSLLARDPGAGHVREDLTNSQVLFWPVGTYLVVYRVVAGQVQVLAVVHGARDVPLFLKRRDPS